MITPSGGWDPAREVDCPNCHLACPPNTSRCDCGYDFATCEVENVSAIVRVAYVTAFVQAALCVIGAVTQMITLLPFACIPLIAGIGIMRKQIWSAYGYALTQSVQLLLIPLFLFRDGGLPGGSAQLLLLVMGILLSLALSALFFFAGRSLEADKRAKRGRPLAWIAGSALFVLPFIFIQPFRIPTGSMEDTLLPGDRILVQRFPKPTPARGLVIVFVNPVDRSQTQVKRIVGVPGDRIRIVNKGLYVNEGMLQEPHSVHRQDYVDSYRDNFPSEPNVAISARAVDMLQNHVLHGEVVVPAGKLFVLGDNRDLSLDSRYLGFVDFEDLIGKPILIYDSETIDNMPFGSGGILRVRWGRLFKTL